MRASFRVNLGINSPKLVLSPNLGNSPNPVNSPNLVNSPRLVISLKLGRLKENWFFYELNELWLIQVAKPGSRQFKQCEKQIFYNLDTHLLK